jgi:hypothetical protein
MHKSILVLSLSFIAAAPAVQAQKKLDACTLVTKADVQEAVGGTVADPQPNKTNPAVCDFKTGTGNVSFMTQAAGGSDAADKLVGELKKRKIPVAEVKGIGDRSFFVSHGYGMTQLNTYKGPHYIILTMMLPGAGEEKQKAASEKLMKKALAKL